MLASSDDRRPEVLAKLRLEERIESAGFALRLQIAVHKLVHHIRGHLVRK